MEVKIKSFGDNVTSVITIQMSCLSCLLWNTIKKNGGIIICGSSHQISEIGQYSSEEKTKEVFYQIIQEIKLGTKVFEMPNDD